MHIVHNHISDRPYQCDECNFVTSQEFRLKNHKRNCHPTLVHSYSCTYDDCTKTFCKRLNLKYHIQRCHKGELKFECDDPKCDKKFFTYQEKKAHFGNCHGPRNVICDVCGANFNSTAMLRKHMRARHSEISHVCDQCNQKYRSLFRLKDHVKRVHLNIRDFKCEQCGEEWFRKRDLDHHIASKHLGIRYQCGVGGCNSTLARKDAYITHLRSHTLTAEEKKDLLEKLDDFVKLHNLPK